MESINPEYYKYFNSLLKFKPYKLAGKNPSLTYELSGKTYELPRFSSPEMQMARVMNKIAIEDGYQWRSFLRLDESVTLPEDLKRLLSKTVEDSYKRAFWINPKDNKGYHLLDEGMTADGNQKLRILNERGEFVKNAVIKPKTVILNDLPEGANLNLITDNDNGISLNHTDLINIFARRYNPFAKYKTVVGDDLGKLQEAIDKNTTCISMSWSCSDSTPMETIKNEAEYVLKRNSAAINVFKDMKGKTRILAGSGNFGKDYRNALLYFPGVEGVGGLDSSFWNPKIHKASSSVNSLLTQHYEHYEFPCTGNKYGINITGLPGTDYPILFCDERTRLGLICGTSYSTPIRAAKLALNEMMEGVF